MPKRGKPSLPVTGASAGLSTGCCCRPESKTTVLDYSSAQLAVLRAYGVQAFYGDATRPDLLEAAGIAETKMLVIAIDQRHAATQMEQYVRRHFPHVYIVARAIDRFHVYELYSAGTHDIIRDTFDSSVRAGRSAHEAFGMHPFDAETMARAFTEEDKILLRELAELYDPDIPNEENEPLRQRAKEVMAEREAQLASRGQDFRIRTERGWSPPSQSDADAHRNLKKEN